MKDQELFTKNRTCFFLLTGNQKVMSDYKKKENFLIITKIYFRLKKNLTKFKLKNFKKYNKQQAGLGGLVWLPRP